MKVSCLSVIVLASLAIAAFSQGPLTPAGAPGATMRSLAQVEPRIPIDNAPITITRSGSYYLTTNLSGAITINANLVTLDLMGYYISASGSAIIIPLGQGRDVVIRNGILRCSSGAGTIIDARYIQDGNSRFENLWIDGNGSAWAGLYVGSGCLIRNCDVVNCDQHGIIGNSTYGGLEVRDCRVTRGLQDGVSVYRNSRVVDNVIEYNGGDGLLVSGTGSYIAGNLVRNNTNNYNLADGNQLNLLLSQVPENINWPCSVKFAGTLICSATITNGITVNASDVTIDLDGHALIGPGVGSFRGIYQTAAYNNLKVQNGFVRNWQSAGPGCGILAGGANCVIQNIQSHSNYYGLVIGIAGQAINCNASYNAHYGIYAYNGARISGCVASFNANSGIYASGEALVINCTTYRNAADGITAVEDCKVSGNLCSYNGLGGLNGAGIRAMYNYNSVEDNLVTHNARGIYAASGGNLIMRNRASQNATNWVVVGGNVCLIQQANTCASISGNSGGTAPGSTDPSVNFTF